MHNYIMKYLLLFPECLIKRVIITEVYQLFNGILYIFSVLYIILLFVIVISLYVNCNIYQHFNIFSNYILRYL